MEDTTFKNIEVGDLVVRRGRHSGDVRFVEDVFYSKNPDDLHVLIVNGVEDESFEGERGINRFNKEWRLLAKDNNLIKEEPNKETVHIDRGEVIYSYPSKPGALTIHKIESEKIESEDSSVDYIINQNYVVYPTIAICNSLGEILKIYEEARDSFALKFPEEVKEVEIYPWVKRTDNPIEIYKDYGATISYFPVGDYYFISLSPPVFFSLRHFYVWLCDLVDKLKELVIEEENNEKYNIQ